MPNAFVGQLLAVLHEALDGSPHPWSYFTDGPDAGLLRTLDTVSAADASRRVGGTSVAAHAHHVIFGLDAATAFICGDPTPRDWPVSWSVIAVDEVGWDCLRDEVRAAGERLRRAIEEHAASGPEAAGGSIGAVAHLAYHLGAVRQKLAVMRRARSSGANP
jgi:hypothetical protein